MSRSTGAGARTRGGDVEIAHFWQAGDGADMLAAVLERFRSRHPDVGVSERSYANHGLAIKSRILQEDPPSLFVEWPGRNLDPYLEAGALKDLTGFWEDNGLGDSFIEGPTDLVTFDGTVVGVPVDIHRMNNLFYDVELVEELGIDPSVGDPREFLEVLRQCEDAGVTGLEQPMKNPSTVLQLWSDILIGQFGAEVFDALSEGRTRAHESEIRESLALLDQYADLASDDAGFLGMVGANQRFMDGDSVFFTQGDWVAGEYDALEGFDYRDDWDVEVFPGTGGVYRLGVDSLVASEHAADEEALYTFLEFVASPDVLALLNRMKGSIPPRRDVSLDGYPEFLRDQFEDFKRAREFPAGHSLQVTPEAFIEAKSAMSDFMVERDVDASARQFVEAYELD